MEKVSINISIEGLRLIGILKESERRYYFVLENGLKLKRNNIAEIKITCDECLLINNLKNIPENFILYRDVYICKSCRNKGESNPMFGKKWHDELKIDRSIKYSGENNPMFGVSLYNNWLNKYGKEEADIKLIKYKQKHSIMNSGENNPMFGKSFYDIWLNKYGEEESILKLKNKADKHRKYLLDNPNHLKKMITNSHNKGYRKTGIEIKIEKYLIENNINYKYNFIINSYQFDFILIDRNIIIETHGDYWHANPNIYSDIDESKKVLNDRQHYKVDKDKEKLSYINNNTNYKIIYLWETDINNNEYKKILKEWNL